MIVAAGKYAAVRTSGPGRRPECRSAARGGPLIFIPRLGREIRLDEWYWRELREGGVLQWYLQRELHTTRRRLRQAARQMDGFRQNLKSELRLVAAIPAREYQRWRKVDPHFWSDDKNLRSFKRDNPDACVYL